MSSRNKVPSSQASISATPVTVPTSTMSEPQSLPWLSAGRTAQITRVTGTVTTSTEFTPAYDTQRSDQVLTEAVVVSSPEWGVHSANGASSVSSQNAFSSENYFDLQTISMGEISSLLWEQPPTGPADDAEVDSGVNRQDHTQSQPQQDMSCDLLALAMEQIGSPETLRSYQAMTSAAVGTSPARDPFLHHDETLSGLDEGQSALGEGIPENTYDLWDISYEGSDSGQQDILALAVAQIGSPGTLQSYYSSTPEPAKTPERAFTKKTHVKKNPKGENKWHRGFECSLCGKSFYSFDQHINHHQKFHSGENRYQCEVCGKGCVSTSKLREHKRVHTVEKPFQCTYCKKTFTREASLLSHERVHTREKPFKCTHCKKAFARQTSLLSHVCVHTGEKPLIFPR